MAKTLHLFQTAAGQRQAGSGENPGCRETAHSTTLECFLERGFHAIECGLESAGAACGVLLVEAIGFDGFDRFQLRLSFGETRGVGGCEGVAEFCQQERFAFGQDGLL